ncbi:MAG: hypothetical protein IKP81_08050 [Paludibacteraceae bacterium]|nr:hypothetical protein [Paludibacteraceae bacterium]
MALASPSAALLPILPLRRLGPSDRRSRHVRNGGRSASFTLAMAYDEVYNITRKNLDLEQHIPLFSTTT